jgi:HK97 family phage major capsid protein
VDFTDEMFEDTMTNQDLYSYIVENVAESQGAFIENQILNGDGTGDFN